MKKLLHIIASPRGEKSRTLEISQVFLESLKKNHPDFEIDEINVFEESLPSLTIKRVDGKYILLGGKEITGEIKKEWEEIEKYIKRFLSADYYLISTPMWNFSIPYPLKHYIDVIIQPRYMFIYTADGPQGLVKNKKMFIITTRGGDYSETSPGHKYDFQEPYLRTIFGLAGITDITFINAQPMDASGQEVMREKIEKAKSEAIKVASSL